MEEVQFVGVVGVPDLIVMELATAVVVKRPGFELTEQMVIDYVAERMPEYNHLHGGAFFIDKMPLTATSKPIKRVLLQMAIERSKSQHL